MQKYLFDYLLNPEQKLIDLNSKNLNSILSEAENIAFLYSSIHSNFAMHAKDNTSCTFNTTAHHHPILALVAIGQVQQVAHQVVVVVMPNNH